MAKIILLSGKGESGKTTLANIIKEELKERNKKALIISFASYLKFIAKSYFEWDGKKDIKGRTLLQYLGTDIVRKKNPSFWVEAVGDFIELFSEEFDFFIIDDCRFIDEVRYFTDTKIIDNLSIRIERQDHKNSLTEEQRNHSSETMLDNYPFDAYIISQNGLENLKESFYKMLSENSGIKDWIGL